MGSKSDNTKNKILLAAKSEFLEKGYSDSSLRQIADKAGVTTGALFSHFNDKRDLFDSIVAPAAGKLMSDFNFAQTEFAGFDGKRQIREMHQYTKGKIDYFVEFIYDYFDEFRLIICAGTGSGYANFIHELADIETKHTERFIAVLRQQGNDVIEVSPMANHILAEAFFNGLFEVVKHGMEKAKAIIYINQLVTFFNAGWDKLLDL